RGFAQPSLYTKDLSDTGGGESFLPPGFQTPDDWSLDGKFIVYTQREDRDAYDLWILPVSGDRKPVLFLRTPSNEENARFLQMGNGLRTFLTHPIEERSTLRTSRTIDKHSRSPRAEGHAPNGRVTDRNRSTSVWTIKSWLCV